MRVAARSTALPQLAGAPCPLDVGFKEHQQATGVVQGGLDLHTSKRQGHKFHAAAREAPAHNYRKEQVPVCISTRCPGPSSASQTRFQQSPRATARSIEAKTRLQHASACLLAGSSGLVATRAITRWTWDRGAVGHAACNINWKAGAFARSPWLLVNGGRQEGRSPAGKRDTMPGVRAWTRRTARGQVACTPEGGPFRAQGSHKKISHRAACTKSCSPEASFSNLKRELHTPVAVV